MAIEKIDVSDLDNAYKIVEIQQLGYAIEAELLDYWELPPLLETPFELVFSEETFLVCSEAGLWLGFVALEPQPDSVWVSRLCVRPAFFQQNIATRLLQAAFAQFSHIRRWRVTTAALNLPARALYEKLGFGLVQTYRVDEGRLEIVEMERVG